MYRTKYNEFIGPASYAQARIWLDERIRFDPDKPQVAIYNMPFVYRLETSHILSVKQLYASLRLIISKHQSLRTLLIFNTEKNQLIQRITNYNENKKRLFTFIESTFETDKQLDTIIHDEKRNSQYFDLTQGLVFRCHLIYHKQISSNDLLCHKDVIIFNFHHALFDFPSMDIFLNDLNQAYTTGQLSHNDESALTYLDYTVIEQEMPMTGASMFWLDALHDCNLDQSLPLPFDRYRLTDENRTGSGITVSFDFDKDLSHHFLTYAISNEIEPRDVALSCYYAFLFKLTNGKRDMCIGINTDGRYKQELLSVIGMFVNAIPSRCQLDSHWSFHQLVEYVHEIITNSMKYSYFPLQRILAQHPNISKAAFLDISFAFNSNENEIYNNKVVIDDKQLYPMSTTSIKISENEIMSKFDFSLTIEHDLDTNQLACTIDASLDLFNLDTIHKIAQRFHSMLDQMFNCVHNQMNKSIDELSLVLIDERASMISMNNTQMSFDNVSCIHHEFVNQVIKHPQKLAVELDEQSLTYSELLHYTQRLSLHLLINCNIMPGTIICQCVERSLSMVIGMMVIEMIGCMYCPLSPQDPQHRLHALVEQTQNRVLLTHYLTKRKFHDNIVSLDVDTVLLENGMEIYANLDRLSSVIVVADNIAYVIFTSGSTGIPKAAQVRHKNFTKCIQSLVHNDIFNTYDTVIQMSRCSFDIHVQEILGILISGASLVMLHPKGTLDFQYLSKVLDKKQITYMHTVPTLLYSFFTFIEQRNNQYALKYLRSLCSSGEAFSVKLLDVIRNIDMKKCHIWNLYGPAEATIDCTVHRVNIVADRKSIPIGVPLCNYVCVVLDELSQPVIIGQDGELVVGGIGVFAGYLERDDLTTKVSIEIDGELFYRTGDLVRMSNKGLLYYQGRKDHQIKLHGQRIELGEIERCLLNTFVTACVVIQWDNDRLVAYVQSSSIDDKQLRQHCQSHLPPHMVPSIFIIMEQLPLNSNGKVDRKRLPLPNLSHLTTSTPSEVPAPHSQLEECIHDVWCQLLRCVGKQISITSNFLSIGGHSLLFIELYYRYQALFDFDNLVLSVSRFLQQPTILQHAKLLQTITTNNIKSIQWHPLHIRQGLASFAQERIYLDEQVRFTHEVAIYNELVVLRVSQGSLSVDRLLRALRYILSKHKILRTSIIFDNEDSTLKQYITDNHQSFSLVDKHIFQNESDLFHMIYDIIVNSTLFDLSNGRNFHCEILRQHRLDNENNDNKSITESDVLVTGFHHAAFDRSSRQIFFNDLVLAYTNNVTYLEDEECLEYIDYTVHERLIDMTLSREFWHSELEGYNIEHPLLLPVDRHRLSSDQRSGLASLVEISFDNDVSKSFLNYASSSELTPFQLGLAIFYTFLFKLTHGQTDLCISCLNANRYRSEIQNVLGVFFSTLPYRFQVDAYWSFDELARNVREKCLSILEHSHYPLQHILANLHFNPLDIPFLQSTFDLITFSSEANNLSFNGASLKEMHMEQPNEVAKVDFSVRFAYDPTSTDNQLLCHFICSRDLFDETVVKTMALRLQHLSRQLFSSNSSTSSTDSHFMPITALDLTLFEETEEINNVVFCRQPIVNNEGM
ncbi:unnamed protein product [Adineta steineri]|uniref:Carrier domain-containing protein n=2 Tax=Adineta steineri TaxID=433720 RepID=A0A815MFZ4_9BILA|nr:unnamed protein product [Adineta steineri]